MRIISTGSKWGNLYNFRYFVNGVRVSESEHDRAVNERPIKSRRMENTSFGFRVVITN